jgi:RNA polymerase sigma-70 factor (ECF subfamily)
MATNRRNPEPKDEVLQLVAASSDAVSGAAGARFRELYEQNFDFVWRTMRYMGIPESSVDDAVQDVFLTAHRRLADFEARSSTRTWLYAITVRVARDQRRGQSRRARMLDRVRDLPHELPRTPFEQTARAEMARALQAVLERLNEDQRDVFVLADLEGVSVPEIATAMNVNVNTIYSRLRLARGVIARALAEAPGGAGDR